MIWIALSRKGFAIHALQEENASLSIERFQRRNPNRGCLASLLLIKPSLLGEARTPVRVIACQNFCDDAALPQTTEKEH